MIFHHQRVAELHRQALAARARQPVQARDHLHRLGPLQVLVKSFLRHQQVVVTEHVVQQVLHVRLPEQRGIQLDADVQVHLRQQKTDDAFDFTGGTAVKRGEREGVADARGKRQIAIARPGSGERRAQFVHDGSSRPSSAPSTPARAVS